MDVPFDEIGPAKILELYSPQVPFRAVVVVDNTALGPAIGGVRISPDVTTGEVARLARTMTMKSAAAGLPHGGGKAGIIADPKRPDMEKVMRVFARMIREMTEYIPAPDLGSDEQMMTWVQDEIGRVCGLPAERGGLPLDQLGATGFGLAESAEIAARHAGIALAGARVAIQGFGSVGKAAAKFLGEKGAVIVAVSDSRGTAWNADGLDLAALLQAKEQTGRVTRCPGSQNLAVDEIFALDCEILIPAATADVIHPGNVGSIKARLILEGANIPATGPAEAALHERGILIVPDFIANAGGLIMAAAEYARQTEEQAFAAIASKIRANTELILDQAKAGKRLPRQAAEKIARERVQNAMRARDCPSPTPRP